jgi:molybdate transport system substrate-binding protein
MSVVPMAGAGPTFGERVFSCGTIARLSAPSIARRNAASRMRKRAGVLPARAVLTAGLVPLAAALVISSARAGTPIPPPADGVAGTVTVLAASSLTPAFQALSAEFEKAHARVEVVASFAGSPALVQQIEQGVPADVVALADEATMERLAKRGDLKGHARIFAQNSLAIAVQAGNPKGITGLADLGRPDLVVALCDPAVPAGHYATEAFAKADVSPPSASQELNVKAVLAKVVLGEADAGVVYTTDLRDAGSKIASVAIPTAHNVSARYPIAILLEAPNPTAAAAFVDYVVSQGQEILARFGFQGP